MRVIGDVHGRLDRYINIAGKSDLSLQLGDMSYNYERLIRLDAFKHKFIGGNHEDYDKYHKQPHAVGNWGCLNEEMDLPFKNKTMFIRGAFSPNVHSLISNYYLTGEKKWFYDEELSENVLDNCIYHYSNVLPDIVLSHDCPIEVKNTFPGLDKEMKKFGFDEFYDSRTQTALQCMFNIHKPKLWIFGHWHRSYDKIIQGTRFICLDKLEYKDITKGEFKWLKI